MAEQRDDGKPGSDIEPAGPSTPASPPLDPAQLAEFRQFQQFQDYLKFTQAQQGNQPAPPPDAGMVQAPPTQPATQSGGQPPVIPPGYQLVPAERRRAPKWLSWLGKKVIAWVLAIVILGLAGTWLYNHFFPSDAGKSSAQLAQEGGGTYHTNHVFSKNPYEAVRFVYQDIAQGSVEDACGRFVYNPGTHVDIQSKFARDVGQNDCRQAVQYLHSQVQPKDRNDYAESVPSYVSEPLPGDVVTIDSCSFPITGGPALGTFTVTKVDMGQWLITNHAAGPAKCGGEPAPPSSTPTS
ncbi:hypothetical protein [Amycolatopsis sp. NPDC004378]